MVRQEEDDELKYRIRPIEFVMHNPNLFWVSPYDAKNVFETLGGIPWLLTTAAGVGVSVGYYRFGQAHVPSTFYVNVMRTWGRVFFGLAIGGGIGFLRFGDRQRLHNAYTSYRIRRRYKESVNIDTKDLWKLKGHKPHQEYYQWQ